MNGNQSHSRVNRTSVPRKEHRGAPGCSLPFVKALKGFFFSEGVDVFDVWVCLFKEDVELQKAKCFLTQKGTQ